MIYFLGCVVLGYVLFNGFLFFMLLVSLSLSHRPTSETTR